MSKVKTKRKLSPEELYAFSDEMGMMIEGGVPAVEAITLMLEESDGEADKRLLKEMQDVIYETSSFSKAVEKTGVFPEYYNKMISLGESTGKTDSTLISLSHHYERQVSVRKAVKSAIGYPLLMVAMMFAIIIVLITKIMPIFEKVFNQLGSEMEGVSGGLLSLGKFLGRYAAVFLILIALIVVGLIILANSKKGKDRLIGFGYHFKSIRSIIDKLSISSFASGMAMTLSSGMDIMQALELSSDLIISKSFREKIEKCKESFMETMDIGKALHASGIFTGLYGRMVILSSRTGNMEQTMEKIANTYQEESDDEINGLISIVEPTLVILMSVIVGMILLSVMLPLLSIMAGMN